MITKTYVYDGKEHIMTGRIAEKRLRSEKIKKLYEIRPNDVETGQDMYNKWVSMDDLYEVKDKDETEDSSNDE